MNETQQLKWQEISKFQIDDPESGFTFSDRLARENRWSIEYTLRVIKEYKKFIFLLCNSKHPLTPSDQIDQAWHLHLLYTENYWVEFCEHTLMKKIHHGPTKGGNTEKSKFTDWYERTIKFYEDIFNTKPPEDIWPSSSIRFSEINFARVSLHRYWIIPKFQLFKKWKS